MFKKKNIKRDYQQPEKRKKFIRRIWMIYIILFIGILSFFTMISFGWLGFMPTFEELENPRSNLASEIYSSDQKLLGKYYIENRSNVQYQEISPYTVNALIATEDIRFYEHSGIDLRALARALMGVITFNNKGGGSTITQQLAKNLFPRPPQNKIGLVMRKFKEWIIAIKLERNYTKEEILAMYLNTVDFGSQSFGIKSAAKTFFGKRPIELNTEESALLVGMLKAPTYFSPVKNPDNAFKRRNVVLGQMLKYKFISPVLYDSLTAIPLNMSEYNIQDHHTGIAKYFREYLRMTMTAEKPQKANYASFQMEQFRLDSIEWVNNPLYGWCNKTTKPDGTSYNLYTDGLKIYTTINSKMQNYAEEAVEEHLGEYLQPLFFKHWKGHKRAPYSWNVSNKQIETLMQNSIKRSERYRALKEKGLTKKEIEENFETPVKMKVFTWNGPKDTVLTPKDSIRYYKYFLHTGLMSMEPQTGYVRAYVGGIDYDYFKYDHVSLSRRQVGSTFKPFVYTLAIQDLGYSPCTWVPNAPVAIELPNGTTWEPKNSGYKDLVGKMVTLKSALARSLNYVSAYLMQQISPYAVVKLVKKMGVKTNIPVVYSLALGSSELSVYEMVGAMNTYANQGLWIEPIFVVRIEDKMGNVIQTFSPRTKEAMDAETAFYMVSLMRGVVEGGTGARIRYQYNLKGQIAGKTGTTNNNSDGWFMGLVPNLVTGVWVGADERAVHFRSTDLGQGASMALPIWAKYIKKIYADKSLRISESDVFEKPIHGMKFDQDCGEYKENENQSIEEFKNEF